MTSPVGGSAGGRGREAEEGAGEDGTGDEGREGGGGGHGEGETRGGESGEVIMREEEEQGRFTFYFPEVSYLFVFVVKISKTLRSVVEQSGLAAFPVCAYCSCARRCPYVIPKYKGMSVIKKE